MQLGGEVCEKRVSQVTTETEELKSKTEIKKEMHQLQDFAQSIIEMSKHQRSLIPLSEELKDAMGDTILMDGIPAILFLPEYSYEELEDITKNIIDLFSPNLILGISDELPPVADIEKVRFVSKLLENY